MTDWKTAFVDQLSAGPYGNLLLLIHYGSGNPNTDSDYFGVFDSNPPTPSIMVGSIDFWMVGNSDFHRLLQMLDPFVTEPVLTGSVLVDSAGVLNLAKQILKSATPTPHTVTYLVARSADAFSQARQFAEAADSDPRLYRAFWSSMLFSVSYWVYAKHYAKEPTTVITLTQLVPTLPDQLQLLWNTLVEGKQHLSQPDKTVIDHWSRLMILG